MVCKHCGDSGIRRNGHTEGGIQRYRCMVCQHTFIEGDSAPGMKYTNEYIAETLHKFYLGEFPHEKFEHGQASRKTVQFWAAKYTEKAYGKFENVPVEVSDVWLINETELDMKGKSPVVIWDCIDSETQFLLASRVIKEKSSEEAASLIQQARWRARKPPKSALMPRTESYENLRAYFEGVVWIAPPNPMEKAQEEQELILMRTLDGRMALIGRMQKLEKAELIIKGWLIHYNFFRKRRNLDNQTPARNAGAKAPFERWYDVVAQAS